MALEEETYRKLKWRLLPLLMLCYVVAYLDRVNVGFAKLQMLGDLRFTETAYGVGAGLFFLGYILFGLPSNLLIYRVGARIWITSTVMTWGVISGLTASVTTPLQFFALRFLLGAVESGFYPGVVLYLAHWFPSWHRAGSVAIFQSAIAIAGLVGGPWSGWILDHLQGHLGLHGWQWLFAIEALPALASGVMVFFYLDNDIASARWLSPAQKTLLIENLSLEERQNERLPLSRVFADGRVWQLAAVVFGLALGVYALAFWTPTLLHEAGVSSYSQLGWLSAVPNLVAMAGVIFWARSSDHTGERRWHVALAALLGSLGLISSVVLDHHVVLLVMSLSLASIGFLSALPVQWTLLTGFMGGSSAAAAIGLINSMGNLGGLVSPAWIGWVKDRTLNVDLGLYAVAACAAISAILALKFPAQPTQREV